VVHRRRLSPFGQSAKEEDAKPVSYLVGYWLRAYQPGAIPLIVASSLDDCGCSIATPDDVWHLSTSGTADFVVRIVQGRHLQLQELPR